MKIAIARNAFFYVLLIGVFSVVIYWIATEGDTLEEGRHIVIPEQTESPFQQFVTAMEHNFTHPLAILLAQIVSIVIVARLFGWVCKKVGQPTVIGEIIAGIVLGPSLVGMYFPEFSAALFPAASLPNLQFLSQIGLILFMFVVGMELDLSVLKNKAHEAVVISHASIIIPFSIGMGLSYFIYEQFAPQNTQFLPFALFMGIAMSITAFPVLARIVQERGIQKTRLGTIVITCAAADDITAWCLLAAVIAIAKAGSFVSSVYVIALSVGYVLLMLKVVRPFLKRVGDLHASSENLSKPVVAIFFVTLILSAYATEVIGIHALFGAFLAGVIMPDNTSFRNLFIEKIEDVALVLLLPLFFVFTGLRTQIGLLDDVQLWQVTGLIVLAAVVGKFAGSALPARFVGQNWKDSLSIGALMNTRGLMELVVLNIGYDLGVLGPEIFAMMVIMALVTTIMTGPALDIIDWTFKKREVLQDVLRTMSQYRILISFGRPESGKALLQVSHALTGKNSEHTTVTLMHLFPSGKLHHYNADVYEKTVFSPALEESKRLNQKAMTLFRASEDIESGIADTANNGNHDLLLIGLGKSIFEGSLLGKLLGFTTRFINPDKLIQTISGGQLPSFDERTSLILSKTKIPVGILIDKQLTSINKVLIGVVSQTDRSIVPYVQRLISNSDAQIELLDMTSQLHDNTQLRELFQTLVQKAPERVTLTSGESLDASKLKSADLILFSLSGWTSVLQAKAEWLPDVPSTLVIRE
jgi:Kef-type K+ transport system membrane component KefB